MSDSALTLLAEREAEAAQRKVEESRRRYRCFVHGDPQVRFATRTSATGMLEEPEVPLLQHAVPSNKAPSNGSRGIRPSHPLSISLPVIAPRRTRSFGLQRQFSLDTIPHRGAEWRWLNTVAFFVGATFIIGAILFTSGAAAACLANPIVVSMSGVHIAEWQARGAPARDCAVCSGRTKVDGWNKQRDRHAISLGCCKSSPLPLHRSTCSSRIRISLATCISSRVPTSAGLRRFHPIPPDSTRFQSECDPIRFHPDPILIPS
jgi:hypothetical protein